ASAPFLLSVIQRKTDFCWLFISCVAADNEQTQFYFRTTDVTGTIELPEGVEMVMPGDNIKMVVTLIHPIAMDDGLRFAIREGGRTVGAGVVAKVLG
ncbi:hypothetical protein ACEWFB_25455, partial [Klebsiella pneumoniae]|uniref:EF-Tu C-terminal domain-related protein n=1 Tax=Klebsiella pneumoniae TaxID=573 RepID=UPI0035B6EBFD